MTKLVILLLRGVLVVLLLGSVLAQLLVPVLASAAPRTFPEVEPLVIPYAVAGILVIACGQVALLAVWRLLSLINHGVIFTRRALRWVDLIMACGGVATVLNAGVWIHLLVVAGGGPGIILWLLASSAVGSAFVLLMIVMRSLLATAIADRAELYEVI